MKAQARWSLAYAAVAVLLTITACTVRAEPAPDPPRTVTATPTGFTLDGNPWWPSGMDAYQLATNWSINRGCGAQVDLDAYFGSLPPNALTRFDLFAALAVDKFTGAVDFRPADAVFAAAARHRQMVLPVLVGGDGACESGEFKQRAWYIDGWKTETAFGGMTYRQWLTAAVTRWRGSPALAGWEPVGEPEPGVCGRSCAFPDRTCPPDAGAVLRGFFDAAGGAVRALDPGRPVFSGLAGGGQCGSAGDDYELVGRSPGVDVLDYHDYGADGVPLPGDQWNGLARRIAQAKAVGKPIVVNEIGQNAGSCGTVDDRATDVRRKVTGQRAAGTAGALFWAFVPDPRNDQCTFDIGPGDPLFGVAADMLSQG